MKISLDWLREYAVLDAPLDTLVQGLVDTGTEVDRVERGPAGIIVARVVGLEPFPNRQGACSSRTSTPAANPSACSPAPPT